MSPFLRGLVRAVADTFPLPGPILEVGSYIVAGQEGLGDLRPFFPGRPYVGLDKRPGPGVDLVADVERLPLAASSVGTVLALSTFEHVQRFWAGLDEVRRVLRPDGALLIACPFYFHLHEHPSDYWRFSPQALELLLSAYPSKLIGWHGPESRPANVWALARGPAAAPITLNQLALYRARMARHARMPLPWPRRLRYALGRLLCGRRPFAPYLDREQWQCRLLQNAECGMRNAEWQTEQARPAEREVCDVA
jgi:SAM-dependent methyltransferase